MALGAGEVAAAAAVVVVATARRRAKPAAACAMSFLRGVAILRFFSITGFTGAAFLAGFPPAFWMASRRGVGSLLCSLRAFFGVA